MDRSSAPKWSGPNRARRAQPQHGRDPQHTREAGSQRPHDDRQTRRDEPAIPPGVEAKQLSPEVRRELSTLDRATADAVARHLVAAGALLDDDPMAALRHARAARGRSGRITAVREAVGIAAYRCGDWAQALAELRTARRMGSKSALLPLIADCERGLGRPQRAIELAGSPEAAQLSGDEADELRIVAAGARADLGQLEQALTMLSGSQPDPGRIGSTAARLSYAYAETLLALGRDEEALRWFLRSATADTDGVTDAEDRISELAGSKALLQRHDCLLIDLDGTVFRGEEPTTGAVESLEQVHARKLFITNNASRSAAEVAAHLSRLGFDAGEADVVTSAQVAAQLLSTRLPAGSRVLVVGTEALAAEVAAVGLQPVRDQRDGPAAVIQGHSTDTGWADLAEAALAIRAGAVWMTTNVDRTLPSERGLLPGNGAMVAALHAATDAEPQTAGKPSPALMTEALARGDYYAPLVVGDRLDTDIAGANAAGLPSLMVLTGVNSARDAVEAAPGERPTYIARDLRSLHADAGRLAVAAQPRWHVHISDATVTVNFALPDTDEDGLSVVRSLARAVWDADFGGRTVTVEPGDEVAREALEGWSLLGPLAIATID